ncbi:MAG: Uma2 family endonuclease [Chloroflexaceae bacterium]|nr:Uma2 family endonuclease [Chloroflexaceae bacterium]
MTDTITVLAPPDTPPDEISFHYYDRHPTREDLLGKTAAQNHVIHYLMEVLFQLYRTEGWFVVGNLNIYLRKQRNEYPLAPDIAVFKGVQVPDPTIRTLRSWRLYEPGRTPPQVVFEFASEETWREDLDDKPGKYAALGVSEYFACDPNSPPFWRTPNLVRGWRLVNGSMHEQLPDGRGWLWSEELDSWLGFEDSRLRLYDRDGTMRPTREEAARAAEEAERAAKEAARAAEEAERAAKEAARAAEEAARAAEEAERAAKEAAWAKLRELGVDPETL